MFEPRERISRDNSLPSRIGRSVEYSSWYPCNAKKGDELLAEIMVQAHLFLSMQGVGHNALSALKPPVHA